jgi:ketosteroid isomerase-like protein
MVALGRMRRVCAKSGATLSGLTPRSFAEHGDCVAVMARTSAKGKTSGAAIDMEVAHLWTIGGGRIARFQTFASHAEALEAVGLRE